MDVNRLVMMLRSEGSDTAGVEAKRASGGLPEGLAALLSAFANRPGGGIIVFGLDESAGFVPTGVYDAKALKQGVADIARKALEPPVTVSLETVVYAGADLVVAEVAEAAATLKPVVVRRTGKAYLRQYDATVALSDQEVAAFIANRGQPAFDVTSVPAASEDLDPGALAAFVAEQRTMAAVFSTWPDERILRHARVLAGDGTVTAAGLLVFGVYPQGILPGSGIQASCWSGPAKKASSTLIDSRALVGPVPELLEQALAFVARNAATAIEARGDGHLYNRPAYPGVAVRELVANALVHRDLGPYAGGAPVSLILEPGQLIISNPGGLFGLTVDSLGRTDSHLRNPHLAQLLLTVRSRDGLRVIERLGSGIPRAISALEEAGMSPPVFQDTGLRFTARLIAGRVPAAPPTRREPGVNDERVLASLAQGQSTIRAIRDATGLTDRQVRYCLNQLVESGRVTAGRGAHTNSLSYSLGPGGHQA